MNYERGIMGCIVIDKNINNINRNKLKKKIDLYFDCDGVILDTIATARRLAKEEGYNPNNFDELHEFFLKLDWNKLIKEAGVIDDAITKIKKIIATGKYNVKILTKLSGNTTEEDAKRIFFKEVLPEVEVITLKLKEHKDEIVNPVGSILVEDSLHNFRRWSIAKGVSVLLLKGEYIYDYPDEKRITDEERLNFVDDIAKFEKIEQVRQLLVERKKIIRLYKRETNTRSKYTKMLIKTRHN